MRVVPHGASKRQKHGGCSLCGTATKLSKTHVPPKAAGNSGPARMEVEFVDDEGTSYTGLGRPSGGGGMWGWWFCQTCNWLTRKWDEEFMRWSIPLVEQVQRVRPKVGTELFYEFRTGDPGAFVRGLWAWAFAVDPLLRTEYGDVARSVIDGEPVESS